MIRRLIILLIIVFLSILSLPFELETIAPTNKLEETKTMLKIARKSGVLDDNIYSIINSALYFDKKSVQMILTPVDKFISIEISEPIERLKELFLLYKKRRVVVYKKNINNIIGFIAPWSYIQAVEEGKNKIEEIEIFSPIFIDKSYLIDDLLIDFQSKKVLIAFVKDKRKIIGLVTIENLLEEIVGEMFNEYERDRLFIRQIDKDCFKIRYDCTIEEFNKYFKDIQIDDSK